MTGASSSATNGPDPLVGRVINDRYKIVGLLARGGMGKVYQGEQAPLGRKVALKVLHPNYKGEHDPDFHRRFFLEAATCAKLTHPNTVTIFDYGRTDDDIYYIAMELLEGRTLHRALREDGPLPPARALHICRQVCRSLREAHAIHVVHRDLKPANVFLCKRDDDSDFVKVLDFGLVKNTEDTAEDLTQTGLFMGSPKYMAPEQIQGERADGRVDIYALGVMLYEMLTGKVPFDRPNSVNILMAHVHDDVPSFDMVNPELGIPPVLEGVVKKCLAKKPIDRYATMDQLLVALKEAGEPGALGPPCGGSSGGPRTSADPLAAGGENSAVVQLPQPSMTPSGVVVLNPQISGGVPVVPSAPSVPTDSIAPSRGVPGWIVGVGGVAALVAAVGVTFVMMGGGQQAPVVPPPTTTIETQTGTGADPGGSGQTGTGTDPSGTGQAGNPSGSGQTGSTGTGTGTEPVDTPAAPARLRLTLTSSPEGATVRLGTRRLGTTPLEMELEGDDARAGTEHAFVFSLPGYQVTTLRRTVEGDTLSVDARLTRRTGGMTGDGQSHVEGYRDDPYAEP